MCGGSSTICAKSLVKVDENDTTAEVPPPEHGQSSIRLTSLSFFPFFLSPSPRQCPKSVKLSHWILLCSVYSLIFKVL